MVQVRGAAAVAAGGAMGAVAGVQCAGLHVEQIERQAFQFLGLTCGHLPSFQQQLTRWIHRSVCYCHTSCKLHKVYVCCSSQTFLSAMLSWFS